MKRDDQDTAWMFDTLSLASADPPKIEAVIKEDSSQETKLLAFAVLTHGKRSDEEAVRYYQQMVNRLDVGDENAKSIYLMLRDFKEKEIRTIRTEMIKKFPSSSLLQNDSW